MRAVWPVFRKSVADVVAHLGSVSVLSVAWAVPFLCVILSPRVPGAVGPAFFLAGWTLLGPATAVAWYGGHRIARGDPVDLAALREGLRLHLRGGFIFLIVNTIAVGLMIANVRFYTSSTVGILGTAVRGMGEGVTVGRLVALPWIYALIFWLLMQLYALPLVMEQGTGIGAGIRRAAILILDNPLFTVTLAAAALILMTAYVVSVVGLLLLAAGSLAVLTSNAVIELLKKYAAPA